MTQSVCWGEGGGGLTSDSKCVLGGGGLTSDSKCVLEGGGADK